MAGPIFPDPNIRRGPLPGKKSLSEAEICDRYITPALKEAGWYQNTQIRREYSFTAGRVIVRGAVATRGKKKRADYLLNYRSHLPLAVVEARIIRTLSVA